MDQDNFMIAVVAESFMTGIKSDPRFVKWVASYQISTDDSYEAIHYPMYPCTDEQYAKFYPPEERAASRVRNFQETQELFCMDDKAREHMLYGGWRSGSNYRALDVQIIPCASRYVAYDGTVSEDDGSCDWELENAIEYLGGAYTIGMNSNQGKF